jgi:hypothetical protein
MRESTPVESALYGPNREPRRQNVKLIGCCLSVRPWLCFLGCPCVEEAANRVRINCGALLSEGSSLLGLGKGNITKGGLDTRWCHYQTLAPKDALNSAFP